MRVEIPCRKRKLVAQLIDPDRAGEAALALAVRYAAEAGWTFSWLAEA